MTQRRLDAMMDRRLDALTHYGTDGGGRGKRASDVPSVVRGGESKT